MDCSLARPRPIAQAISLEKFRSTDQSEKMVIPIDPQKPLNFSISNDLQYTVYVWCILSPYCKRCIGVCFFFNITLLDHTWTVNTQAHYNSHSTMINGTEVTRPSLNALTGWSLICYTQKHTWTLGKEVNSNSHLYPIHVWSPLYKCIKQTAHDIHSIL